MKKKNIGFIARGLTKNGVRQFIVNVLREWNKNKPDNVDLFIFTDEQKFADTYPNLNIVYIGTKNKLIWDYVSFPLKARKFNLDTVIYTKNVIPLTNLLYSWEKLVIVYDLGYLHPELNAYRFWDTLYMKLLMGISFKYADKIMAISKFTKSELIKFFNIPEEKIFVNYLGVNEKYKVIKNKKLLNEVQNRYNLKSPFVFYVGSLSPRKNILRALKAFNRVKDKIPHMFYLISSRSWDAQNIYDCIENHLKDRVRIIEDVPDKDLVAIYNLADALIYVSLYEGFGLPVLEALATGCRVITSKNTSCEEIGNLYVESVDMNAVNEISEAYLNILNEINAKRTVEGMKYSNNFKWEFTSNNLITQAERISRTYEKS